jgi:hypothetical protein
MQDTGITLKQLTNWMVNNRKRIWKPKIEARIQQQAHATVAAVAAQAHQAALTAVTFAQQATQMQEQKVLSTSANPVTPEGRFKPTLIMPVPSDNLFFDFDKEASRKHNQMDQLELSSVPSVKQSVLPPSSDAATKALQVMLLQQLTNLVNVAKFPELVSEPVTPVSQSVSDEDISVSAREQCEESLAPTVLFEKTPEHDDGKNYARNVSFSSLELISGSGDHAASTSPTPLLTSPVEAADTYDSNKRSWSSSSSSSPTPDAVVERRNKYRRVSLDMWVDACNNASHIHDESLPTLEEASRLFGYSK